MLTQFSDWVWFGWTLFKGTKLGQSGSNWPSYGSRFGFNLNFYIINPIYGSGRVSSRVQSRVKSGWPSGSKIRITFGLSSYSRVHKSPPPFFTKILEKPSIVQKKKIPHINGLGFSLIWSKKKIKMADLKNSKWPPQKNLIFQLRQFSIFFHEIPMDWSLG